MIFKENMSSRILRNFNYENELNFLGKLKKQGEGLFVEEINDLEKLLKDLSDKDNRNAHFKTVMALIIDGKEYLFEGIINGIITTEKSGANGFGYDPIFLPNGYTETFAEMSSDIKNVISHRAKAMKQLVEFVNSL